MRGRLARPPPTSVCISVQMNINDLLFSSREKALSSLAAHSFYAYTPLILLVTLLPLVAFQDRRRHPPGPKRLPLIGNALQMPTVRPWETYSKWAKELKTEIMYLNVFTCPIIVIDSIKPTRELLEKRSAIYSDRPVFPFFDLMGWSWAIQFIGYGEKFKRHRKPLHTYLSQSHVQEYWPIQQSEARHLLNDLLCSPQDFLAHINHAAAGMSMTLLYGVPRGPKRTGMIRLADQAIESLVAAGNYGDHLVDLIPAMKHIPEWVPGAGFQKQAREWREVCERYVNLPFEDIKTRIATSSISPCLVGKLLEVQVSGEEPDMDDYLIKSTAGVVHLGGADTLLSSIHTFFLAMKLYPEVQKRAQAEIDAICGKKRLPTLNDKSSMPYMEALMRELFRWNPTTPLGVPHRLSQDDIYDGYLIPKGSVIMTNLWSIFHDPELYADPFRFDPSRYLSSETSFNPDVVDPRPLTFGFGRRLCPGRFLADSALWTLIASILATFDITDPSNLDGKGTPSSYEYSTGLVSRPLPFTCTIRPRGDWARSLVLSSEDQ